MALTNAPWWEKSVASPPHVRLMPLVHSIQRSQSQRYVNMRKMRAVYEYGFGASSASSNDMNTIDDRRLHFNPAKNAIDTMHAQVCTPRISPMIMTEGGTRAQRERAKMATRALEGVLDDNGFDEIQEAAIKDGLVAYMGFANVFSRVHGEEGSEWGELVVERVHPEDVFVDAAEARDCQPRCLYRRRFMDRFVALADFGKADPDLYGSAANRTKAIKNVKSGRETIDDWGAQESDMIEVWEAWHLPSGTHEEDAKHDGLHVIVIDGATLLVEPWNRDCFPIQEYRPEKAGKGYWGLSVMRQAMAGQREYERVTEKIQRAHRIMGSSSLLVSRQANINVRELGNGQGQIVEYDGQPGSVTELTPTPVNPATYQYRESLASDILRYLGVSEFGAQSEVPAGFTNASGKALNALEDTESKRGIIRHRARERFVTGVARLILEEAQALLKLGIKVESRYREKGSFQRVDWSEIVDVLEDKKAYVVKVLPVGALDKTPAAKFAQLDNWLERQIVTVDQYKRMADLPDLEAENDVDTADVNIIDKNLDYMVTTGKYLAPQPFDNLGLIVSRGGKYYNAMRVAEVPDAQLELIRRYIIDAKALAEPPPPDPQEPLPMAPPGAPPPMGGPPMGGPPPPMMPPGGPPGAPPMM